MNNATKERLRKLAGTRRWKANVDIPLLGRVALRSITAKEFTPIQDLAAQGIAGKNKAYVSLITHTVWDNAPSESESDGPLFSEDDRDSLLSLDTGISQALVEVTMDFCNIDQADLEELAKNSENGQLSDSPTS